MPQSMFFTSFQTSSSLDNITHTTLTTYTECAKMTIRSSKSRKSKSYIIMHYITIFGRRLQAPCSRPLHQKRKTDSPQSLMIKRLHKFVPQHSLNEPLIRRRMAPRLKLHFLDHSFSKARGPLFARESLHHICDCGLGDEVRVEADVVCEVVE